MRNAKQYQRFNTPSSGQYLYLKSVTPQEQAMIEHKNDIERMGSHLYDTYKWDSFYSGFRGTV